MACFIVPTIFGVFTHSQRKKVPQHWHINWLIAMVFGGALGLTVEHYAHGEIVPWPPFLTAMASPADTAVMLKEMAMIGIPMTVGLIAGWAVLVYVYNKTEVPRRLGIGVNAAGV